MSDIVALLSGDLPSKRIFLFEGQPEVAYLEYVREIISTLRQAGPLLVEHLRSKECSPDLLLKKLHSLSCFEKILFTYDDPKFPVSQIGKMENFLCLYSSDGFKLCPERGDLVKISFSKNEETLEELVSYYLHKYSLKVEQEATLLLTKHIKRDSFSINEEILKLKHYFCEKSITLEDLLTVLEVDSPSVNEFCRSIFTMDGENFCDALVRFTDDEGMLIIRCLMKYCDAVLDIVAAAVCDVPKSTIIQNLRKKQFYDLKMVDQVLRNPSYAHKAKIMLLRLPVLEEKYKLFPKGRFVMLSANLMDLFVGMDSYK